MDDTAASVTKHYYWPQIPVQRDGSHIMFRVAQKKLTIEEKFRAVFSDVAIGTVLSASEIVAKVVKVYPDVSENSVLPADRCYNITNVGLAYDHSFRIFEHVERAVYRYLGEKYPYCGKVTWKDEPCGSWADGVLEKGENWPYRR